MKMPNRLYEWIDRRERVPWWVRVLWPECHFCHEFDGLLRESTTDRDPFGRVEFRCDCFKE